MNENYYEKPTQLIENAYSYVRLSSKRQTKGTGKERQSDKERLLKTCEDRHWKLSPQTFSDLGVSAFNGKNLLKGDLGNFIRLHNEGKLLPNPVLIIEHWDRFSRQDIDESHQVVTNLLKSGVAIHIMFNEQTFTAHDAKDLGGQISVLVALKQAHDYSKNLSRRVKAGKSINRNAVLNGATLNVNRASWIIWNDDKKKFELNDKAEVVKEIFRLYLLYGSCNHVCKLLNDRNIPSFYNRKWSRNSVKVVVTNKAVLGWYKTRKDLFPQIVSEDDFNRVQALLDKNKTRRGKRSDTVNLFKGLIFCSYCGAAVEMAKGRTHRYYRCRNHPMGSCPQSKWAINVPLLEDAIFATCLTKTPSELLNCNEVDIQTVLDGLNARLQAVNNEIAATVKTLSGVDLDELHVKLNQLKQERDQLNKEIIKTKGQVTGKDSLNGLLQAKDYLEDNFEELCLYHGKVVSQLRDLEIRTKLAAVVPTFLKRLDLKFAENGFVATFQGGKQVSWDIGN